MFPIRSSSRLFSLLFPMLLLAASATLRAADAPKPNILFILADDLGWGDVGFHHGNVPTPNLDRLAKEGVELTQHYVFPVCSPTRAAFLSGRYASRFGVTAPQNQRAYRFDTVTLAKALKGAGYETALTGKWHLGSKPEWSPQKFGFDHSYGSLAGGVGPWDHRYKQGEFTNTWHRDGQLLTEEGHVTDLVAREAIAWLKSRGDKPFFLYVPFTAVHIPIREPSDIVQRVPKEITEPSRRQFGADVMHLDDAVGLLLKALDETGKAANTLVIFGSDNGAIPNVPNNDPQYPEDKYEPGAAGGSNAPLHGQKAQVYEGGIRTPAFARWPGKLKPGKYTGVAQVVDWMPTFCALAGYKPEHDLKWDGMNLWPQLTGAKAPEPRDLYIAGPGFRSRAVRHGDWKLVLSTKGKEPAAGEEKAELYDLAQDPNETKDVAKEHPEQVAQVRALLQKMSQADRDAVAND
jgi:arylsulfatase A-like enzyme